MTSSVNIYINSFIDCPIMTYAPLIDKMLDKPNDCCHWASELSGSLPQAPVSSSNPSCDGHFHKYIDIKFGMVKEFGFQ